jgi:hypothetical protein
VSFKTTHTGSLPRPHDPARLDVRLAKGGEAIDETTLDEAIERATAYVIDAAEAGRDQRDRRRRDVEAELRDLHQAPPVGLRRRGGQYEFEDLEQFPGAKARVFGDAGRARRKAPACTAPIEVIDMDAPREDAERLDRLADGHETFMSAASPGVTALFFPNQYYASDEEYVFALAEGCATNTRRSPRRDHAAGRLPGPGDGPPRAVHAPFDRGLPQAHRHERRRAQPRAAEHPGRAAAHALVLGQLPGPAHLRRRPRRHRRHRVERQAADRAARRRQPAPRARVRVLRGAPLPEAKCCARA